MFGCAVRWDVTRRVRVGIVAAMLVALALAAPAVIGAPNDEVAGGSDAPITSSVIDRSAADIADLPDGAVMVLAGTALIGAAAAVRRAA